MRSWVGLLLVMCCHLLLFQFSSSHSLCHPHDSFALLQFKASFMIYPNIETWKNGTDCCSWFGVTCHPISGHVIGLDLTCSGIKGEIHRNSTLFHLSHLQSLNLAYNDFSISQLSSLFAGFVSFTHLNFSYTDFKGKIHSQISHLSKLQSLDLSSSFQLKWKESTWKKLLRNTTVLRELVLDGTDMSLTSIRSLNLSSSLVTLSLKNTRVRWNLTNDIPCLSNLQRLDLSENKFLPYQQFPNLSCSAASLNILDLSHCHFKGSIPSSLLTLPRLTSLHLNDNDLNGQIPNVFHQSSKLEELDLSFNNIGGFIEILNLSHNRLTGIIPQCLVNLSFLEVLNLQNNKLHGTLPNTFSKYNCLLSLNLYDNQLEGLLPESLSNCTQLELLNLGNNQIVDTFPHWLHILSHLKVLVLRANKFHGAISILKTKPILPNLIIFDISDNNFSGSLPIAYIENFKAMKNYAGIESNWQYMHQVGSSFRGRYILFDTQSYDSMVVTMKGINMTFTRIPTIFTIIDLSGNNFEGEIPNVIGDLDALIGLNLSHNKLSGSIPQSMGNLKSLEWLDLSSNMLIGRIPLELTNLNYLEVLNLAQNNLAGEIPQGKQFNTFSNDSYEGNLGLCGSPLSIKCNMIPEQHPPYLKSFGGEQKFEFGWKPVAIGYGCGMIFGVGLGCCAMLVGKPKWFAKIVGPEHI